jgi:hypothetical protein
LPDSVEAEDSLGDVDDESLDDDDDDGLANARFFFAFVSSVGGSFLFVDAV